MFGVLVTSILTYLGVIATGKSNKEKTQLETHTPSWESFVTKIENFYESQSEQLNKRIDELESDVKEIRIELKETRLELDKQVNKYKIVIEYVCEVHKEFPEVKESLKPPEEIQDDLD